MFYKHHSRQSLHETLQKERLYGLRWETFSLATKTTWLGLERSWFGLISVLVTSANLC